MIRKPRPDLAERNRQGAKHGHGTKRTPTYISWGSMRARCLSPTCKDFPGWGGRGIDVDPRWDDFTVFLDDMGERPPQTSLGRIDNDKGYWPSNCRWETRDQQASNKRTLLNVTYLGKQWRVVDLARSVSMLPRTLQYRLSVGWPVEEATSREVTHRNRHRK